MRITSNLHSPLTLFNLTKLLFTACFYSTILLKDQALHQHFKNIILCNPCIYNKLGIDINYLHLTTEKTELQKRFGTDPESRSQDVKSWNLNLSQPAPEVYSFHHKILISHFHSMYVIRYKKYMLAQKTLHLGDKVYM